MRDLSDGPGSDETTPLTFEAPVQAADGPAGRLTDVVVDPKERTITHLVVEGEDGEARLVGAEHLVPGHTPDGAVVLSCSSADVAACESIRSVSLAAPEEFPHGDERADIGVEDLQVIPSFGAAEFGLFGGDLGGGLSVTYDRIPTGSAELRRGSAVVEADGDAIGELSGLRVADGRVAALVLRSGDAIPIGSVTAIETDRITVAP